jgi:hypothetical protein
MKRPTTICSKTWRIEKMVSRSNFSTPGYWSVLLGCSVLLLGCGRDPSGAHGRVTLDGQPLSEALIQFVPSGSGRRKAVATIVNGEYSLSADEGLLPGHYRVDIVDDPPLGHSKPVKGQQPAVSQRRSFPYFYSHQSPLSLEIPSDGDIPSEFNFDLKSKPEASIAPK